MSVSPERYEKRKDNTEVFQYKVVGYKSNLGNCKEDHKRGVANLFGNSHHSSTLIASHCYDIFIASHCCRYVKELSWIEQFSIKYLPIDDDSS